MRDWTQGLVCGRQALYHCPTAPAIFKLYFETGLPSVAQADLELVMLLSQPPE